MRTKLTVITILLLFLFFFKQDTFALENFYKYSNNPLTFNTDFTNWEEIGRFQPAVILDNNELKMWYASMSSSGFKIATTKSSDGESWQPAQLINLTTDLDTHNPFVVKKSLNQYDLYLTVEGSNQKPKIVKTSSSDGINFSNTLTDVITGNLSWESNGVFAPSLVINNNNYFLFYLGWGSLGFHVGLATSTDGLNWTKCPNNPIISDTSDGPFLYEKNGTNYLFYHSVDGIRVVQSTDALSCTTNWSSPETVLSRGPEQYDTNHMISPSVIEKDGITYLYYSGLGSQGWTLNLATTALPQSEKKPVVLVPGLFGSWNKEAIFYKQNAPANSWKLTPFIKEYQGLEDTFANVGYLPNQDYYVFTYDWRKSIIESADALQTFLDTTVTPAHEGQQIDIVAYSLGGLVARTYVQRYPNNVGKLITVGAPHTGTASTYKAVEAGEFDKNDPFEWLAFKLASQLYRIGYEADRQVINNNMPVALDLLSTDTFLSKTDGAEISPSQMNIRNTTLASLQPDFSSIFNSLKTINGVGHQTLKGFKVTNPTLLDQLLDIYPDGRPIQNIFDEGDGIVLQSSARADNDFTSMSADHGELISTQDAREHILTLLDIPHTASDIVSGTKTTIFPSLIFAVLSPATLEVDLNGQTYHENDGIVFIENATSGTYTIKAKGTGNGPYTILIGKIAESNDTWDRIYGTITASPPSQQEDIYTIYFDKNNTQPFTYNLDNPAVLFDELIKMLTEKNTSLNSDELRIAIQNLTKAKQYYQQNNKGKLKSTLKIVHRSLLEALSKISVNSRTTLIEPLSKFENLYDKTLNAYINGLSKVALGKNIQSIKKSLIPLQKHLLFNKNNDVDVTYNTYMLLQVQDKISKAEESISKNNLNLADILLASLQKLLKEVRVND